MRTFLTDQKIFVKLLVAPMLVLLLLIVLAGTSYRGLSNQQKAMQNLFDVRFKNYQDISASVNRITAVHANVYKILSWSQASFDEKRVNALIKDELAALKGIREFHSKNPPMPVRSRRRKNAFTGIRCWRPVGMKRWFSRWSICSPQT